MSNLLLKIQNGKKHFFCSVVFYEIFVKIWIKNGEQIEIIYDSEYLNFFKSGLAYFTNRLFNGSKKKQYSKIKKIFIWYFDSSKILKLFFAVFVLCVLNTSVKIINYYFCWDLFHFYFTSLICFFLQFS